MAKKRKRSYSHKNYSAPRDASAITNGDLFPLRPLSALPRSGRSLLPIEDRRLWSPARHPPSRTPRQVARVLMALPKSAPKRASMDLEVYSFALPKTTAVCARRQIRKQVIHAKGVAGSRSLRKPKRNAMSRISCRRK